MNKKGKLIVISGPSGVGKSTVISRILENHPDMYFSVSATTRKPRLGEVDGVNYIFVTTEKFKDMIERDELLEYAEYVGKYYGTPEKIIDEHLNAGHDVLLDIEVQGAMQIKARRPDSVRVFVAPPNLETLEHRLHKRGTDDEETIRKRVKRAVKEMEYIVIYDYIVVNDELENAVDDIEAIIRAEKLKTK